MANESCLDDSYVSPRISFSHYFPQSSSLNSGFCFHNDTISLESPLADELFLNGKIVPVEIKNIIPPLTHAQEQPACPPPRLCLHATLTGKDSRNESLNEHKINTSKGNSTDQEFSSLREHFLNREINTPLKLKKGENIPPPFSPPGESFYADDVIDEDTNWNKLRLSHHNRKMSSQKWNKPILCDESLKISKPGLMDHFCDLEPDLIQVLF